MAKKVCKNCDFIYEGDKCPKCGNQEYGNEIKGRVAILDPEKSKIARHIGKSKKGIYAIKSK